ELTNIKGIENKGIIFNDYLFAENLEVDYLKEIHTKFSGFASLVAKNFNEDNSLTGIPIRFIDMNYLNPLNLKFTQGGITENSLSIDSLFLGSKFKKFFNINDQLNLNEKLYTINGFVKNNTPFRFDKDYYEVSPFIDDSGFLILTNDILQSTDTLKLISLMGGIQVSLAKDVSSTIVLEDINKLSQKYNLNFTLSKNRDIYENRIIEAKAATKYTLFRSVLFLTISLISLSIIILYTIYDCKKDIGTIILVGAKIKDIVFIVCLKTILVTIVGFICGTILSYYYSITGGGYFEINTTFFMIINTFISTIIFILITLIFPIQKILTIDIKTLIEGDS
ncbi:MAG: FtsX-like permease family protein, partial [Sarcina sp.]